MEKLDNVELLCEDNIGILKINNPPKNLLNNPEFVNLGTLDNWIKDQQLKGIIITGNNRHFSLGANIDSIYEFADDPELLSNKMTDGVKLLSYIENLHIPTLAAINGSCFGGGLEIALSCHIRTCSNYSLFSFPEVEHGFIPGLNGILRLQNLIGKGKTLEMILQANIINAEKALEINLVDYIVPKKELLDFSLQLMKKMTYNRDIDVITSTVQSLNNARKMNLSDAMQEEVKLFCKLVLKEAQKNDSLEI